ncbi:MAG: 5-(carboxyamino)imidazole ribonucleotide mutase [Clostridiales bacterium]|nr:5-(carboxyamino)imidazole ribonucleotide mutase [Clostridiales bacterium]
MLLLCSCQSGGPAVSPRGQDGKGRGIFVVHKKVLVVLGSDSDYEVMRGCFAQLARFGVPFEAAVCSAHRTPAQAQALAAEAAAEGFGVIIAAAGKAAHLAGVLAAHTTLPVVGVPIKSSALDGLDALLSTVQMPKGVPVATVAIDGADNAALLAVQMLALSDGRLAERLAQAKRDMAQEVLQKSGALQDRLAEFR